MFPAYGIVAICALACAAPAALAQDAPGGAPNAKTIQFLISAGSGGGYAAYARTLTRHLGNHLASKPNFVVQSMPGAGGLRATNFLFSQAPKDGSTIGLIHSAVPLAPLYGTKAAQFDPLKFNWIGSMRTSGGVCIAWHESPIKTWQDIKTKGYIVGSSGAGSTMETLPSMINKLFGTNIKIISGYKDGSDVFLAMQRGEVHGRCGSIITAIKTTRPDWITEKKFVVPVAIGMQRHPEYPEVPAIIEFVTDDHTRKVLQLVFTAQEIDRPVLAPPGVPDAMVAAFRAAFDGTMADPAYREDAEKQHLETSFTRGEELARIIAEAYKMPSDVVATAMEAMGNPSGSGGD